MDHSDGSGFGHPCMAEVKRMLSEELADILTAHHASLQEQLSLWMDRKEGAMEEIARRLDHRNDTPQGSGPLDAQASATPELAISPAIAVRKHGGERVSTRSDVTDEPLSAAAAFHRHKPTTPQHARPSTGSSNATEDTTPPATAFHRHKTTLLHAKPPRATNDTSSAASSVGRMSRSSTYSEFLLNSRKEAAVAAFVKNSTATRERTEPLYVEEPPGACNRRRVGRLLRSASSNYFICTVIVVYIITMGFEVEVEDADRTSRSVLLYVQNACNVAFAVELLARIYAEGKNFVCGEDKFYNNLDTMLVVLSAFDMATQVANSDASGGSVGKMMVLRVLRAVRVIRVVRVMRVLTFIRPLRVLVQSIGATVKPLAYAIVLLATIMYSFAVVFTEAARSTQSEHMGHYFGTLLDSMLTLFKSVSNGVSWEIAFQPLSDVHWLYGALFVLYIVFAQLAVLNVMTGQFCSSAIESSHRDADDMISEHLTKKSFYVKQLQALFADIANDDEMLTVDTFEQNMNDEHMKAFFQTLGIKVSDAFELFKLLDQNEEHEHCINLEQFVEGCLSLKGNASAMGLSNLQHEIRWLTQHLNKHLVEIKDMVSQGSHSVRETAALKWADDLAPSNGYTHVV